MLTCVSMGGKLQNTYAASEYVCMNVGVCDCRVNAVLATCPEQRFLSARTSVVHAD